MKNKVLILIGIVLIVILSIGLIMFVTNNKKEQPINTIDNPIQTVSEIELNKEQFINSLEKIKINGSDDTFMITKKIDLTGVTGSFSVSIPYTLTIDGVEYTGEYIMSSSNNNKTYNDNNPKYKVEITNYKKGYIEVKLNKK